MKCLGLRSVAFVTLILIVAAENGTQTTGSGSGTTPTPRHTVATDEHTTQSPESTTTPSAEVLCGQHNKSCDDCLGVPGAKCLWCKSDSSCKAYPTSKVLPPKSLCALDEARWGVCWLNFEALIIGVSTVGGIIILTITCCCVYCCCCRGGNKRKYAKEDARYDAQKMERKAKNDERRSERKERLDEIRRKYGLMKDEPYQRFDA